MDLLRFCASITHPHSHLHKPMRMGADVVATNGHILIRLTDAAGNFPDAHPSVSGFLANAANGHFLGTPCKVAVLTVPPATKCPVCGGAGYHYWVRCDECDGDGEFKHGSHWYDCLECNGEGQIKTGQHSEGAKQQPCYRCDGDGNAFQVVRVGHSAFQRRYIALLQTLPDCELEIGADPMALARFTFEGGHGYLMPCRD